MFSENDRAHRGYKPEAEFTEYLRRLGDFSTCATCGEAKLSCAESGNDDLVQRARSRTLLAGQLDAKRDEEDEFSKYFPEHTSQVAPPGYPPTLGRSECAGVQSGYDRLVANGNPDYSLPPAPDHRAGVDILMVQTSYGANDEPQTCQPRGLGELGVRPPARSKNPILFCIIALLLVLAGLLVIAVQGGSPLSRKPSQMKPLPAARITSPLESYETMNNARPTTTPNRKMSSSPAVKLHRVIKHAHRLVRRTFVAPPVDYPRGPSANVAPKHDINPPATNINSDAPQPFTVELPGALSTVTPPEHEQIKSQKKAGPARKLFTALGHIFRLSKEETAAQLTKIK